MSDQAIRVLLVEDNPGDARLVFELARGTSFLRFELAETLAACLDWISSRKTDIVLLDLGLPDSQGLETLRAVIAADISLPVVVLTGFDDDATGKEAIREGAQDYLIKGKTDEASLLRAIRYALERKLAFMERHEAMAELSAVYESAPAAMMIFDREMRIVKVNQEAALLAGGSTAAMLGRKCGDALLCRNSLHAPGGCGTAEACRTCTLLHAIRDTFADGGSRHGIEHWLISDVHDMARECCLLVSTAMLRAVKEPMVLVCAQDISAQKNVEKNLIQAKEDADAANKAKSVFLANMSHEIRTPLNGIVAMMQLLEMTELGSEQKQYVSMAMTSSDRLTRLLTDLLDLSRIEAGKMSLNEEEFDTRGVCDSVFELFLVAAQGKGILLERVVDPNTPPYLLGDESRLRQILFNLVGNALKFTEKGSVRLDMAPIKICEGIVHMLISVTDTGIGIPPERLDELFQPFSQVENSYTRRYQGAGLGLAIVRRLVELMGGHITMDSIPGEGTSVHIVLPFRLPSEDVRTQRPAAPTPRHSGQPMRILLAEDDSSNAYALQALLEKCGHETIIAKNGREALELLQQNEFDVILMDIQMPIMDGMTAANAVRSSVTLGPKKDIPIIALTAYAMNGDREKFLAAGMNGYLGKPVKLQDLRQVLEIFGAGMKRFSDAREVGPA
ncbi:MAG: response regulator, partial [Desulfovibrionaceae bacterium]